MNNGESCDGFYSKCSDCEYLQKENSNLVKLLAEQKSTCEEVFQRSKKVYCENVLSDDSALHRLSRLSGLSVTSQSSHKVSHRGAAAVIERRQGRVRVFGGGTYRGIFCITFYFAAVDANKQLNF